VAAVDQLKPEQTAALGEVTVDRFMDGDREVRRIRFKLIPKIAALELLVKHHKLYARVPASRRSTIRPELAIVSLLRTVHPCERAKRSAIPSRNSCWWCFRAPMPVPCSITSMRSAGASAGAHAVLTLDRAGRHTTRKLQVPSNISLLHLPPASPELNPTENIWQYLRQSYLSNRVFRDYDDVVEASSSAWNKLTAEQGRVASIGTRTWTAISQGP
jgi:hypothetical protein